MSKNKVYLAMVFLFAVFSANAQRIPSVQELKENPKVVIDYVNSDVNFVQNNLSEKLGKDKVKALKEIFYNKYKYISGSSDLTNFEDQVVAITERLKVLLGSKGIEELAKKENSILVLSGRIYLDEKALK